MIRLIPKKSKINGTIWKSFTILDVAIATLLGVFAVVVLLSNIPAKWAFLVLLVAIAVVMFVPDGDGGRGYSTLGYMIKYAFSRKRYSSDAKKSSARVDAIVPPFEFRLDALGNCYLDFGEYVAGVLEVGSEEFFLKSEFGQNSAISALAALFNGFEIGESAKLVKIDRPINFDEIASRTFGKLRGMESADEPLTKRLVMRSRLNQLDALNNVRKQYRPYYYLEFFSDNVENLTALLEHASGCLFCAGLPTGRLSAQELAVFLKYNYTRNFDEREIYELEPKDRFEWICPKSANFKVMSVTADDVYSATFAVSDYPLTVANAWGANMFGIDGTKVVMNITPVPPDKATKRIDRAIAELGVRGTQSGKASEIMSQDTHIQTLGALLQRLQDENEILFDTTITVTAYNYSGEKPAAFRKRVRREIVSGGFKLSSLGFRQADGFISSGLTKRSTLKNCARGINSESLAAVFPFVFTSVIDPEGMPIGVSNGYPFIFDPWKWQTSKGEFLNANMFVAGTPGSGKSYFAKSLLAQLYGDNAVVYVLDPENEYKYLCRNVGGRFIDTGSAVTGRINPFHIYQMLTEDGEPAPPEATFSAHKLFLENFFATTMPNIHPDALEEINNLVGVCYEKKNIDETTDCSRLDPEDFPVFDDLYALVCDEIENESESSVRYGNLQRAKTYLSKFASGGRFSNLWNGASTLSASAEFTVFNFQSLFEAKNKIASNGQMLAVLRFLEQQIINLREKNAALDRSEQLHPVVVIDEGYLFIDEKNTYALDFVHQWYRRIRKYGGSMIFLTQNLADLVGNSELISKTSAIVNNTQYSFIMTLQGKDVEVLQDVFKARNLTEAEIEEIQRTDKPKGTAFFMGSSAQRAMVQVVTSPLVEALFSRDLKPDELASLIVSPGDDSEESAPIEPTDAAEPSEEKTQKEKESK